MTEPRGEPKTTAADSLGRDAVRAVSVAGRIVNYLFFAVFVLGMLVIGLASFMTTTGTLSHRALVSVGYVAFFGGGFGLLFLSQYLARKILFTFFQLGVGAIASDATPGRDVPRRVPDAREPNKDGR